VGTLKLSTITAPLTVPTQNVVKVADEVVKLVHPSSFRLSMLAMSTAYSFGGGNAAMSLGQSEPMHAVPAVPLLEAASATSKVSWLGFIADAAVLARKGLLDPLVDFFLLTGRPFEANFLKSIVFSLSQLGGQLPITEQAYYELTSGSELGKLSLKEEAAGKVRVFAMVDIWTQWAMQGLHNMLFAYLKTLPNDATFDQHASVRRCSDKALQTGKSFGYDLSAATDRLPILLQIKLLDHIKPNLGSLWAKILVDRDYVLLQNKSNRQYVSEPRGLYRYAVGQPMGALSSWAMLAVTHHLLAQLAYQRALAHNPGLVSLFIDTLNGRPWYSGYEVLGDDIVFFEEEVAIRYLDIMAEIGVPINLAKSVVGENPTFEFAKVLGRKGKVLSEVSWAMFMAQPTLMGRVGIAFSMMEKGFIQENFLTYLSALSRESKFSVGKREPFLFSFAAMLVNSGRLSFANLLRTLKLEELEIFDPINFIQPGRLERTLHSALVGTEMPKFKDSLDLNTFASSRDLRINLIKTIDILFEGAIDGIHLQTTALNPHKDALLAARQALLMMVCFTPEGRSALENSLDQVGAFRLDKSVAPTLSNRDLFLHMIFAYLFEHFFERLTTIWLHVAELRIKAEEMTIEELLGVIDELDRYKEIVDISQRAQKKLTQDVIPDKRLVESPLAIFKQLQSAPKVTEVTVSEPQWDFDWSDFGSQIEIVTVKITPQVPVIPATWSPMSSFNDHFYALSLMNNIRLDLGVNLIEGAATSQEVPIFNRDDPFSVLDAFDSSR